MKEKYISSLRALELASREANGLINVMEKYEPESSVVQSLYSLSHVHMQLLRLEIDNYKQTCEDYIVFLSGQNMPDLIKKISQDSSEKTMKAESIYDKLSGILSNTARFNR